MLSQKLPLKHEEPQITNLIRFLRHVPHGYVGQVVSPFLGMNGAQVGILKQSN